MRNLIGAMLLSAMTVATASAQSGFSVQTDRQILGGLKAAPFLCGINTDMPQKWIEFQLTAIAMRRGWNGAQMQQIGSQEAWPLLEGVKATGRTAKTRRAVKEFCRNIINMRKATRAITG